MHYELIGVIIFQGRSLNIGHYIAYVLNSDNKWFKMDDVQPNEIPVTAYEASIKIYLTSFFIEGVMLTF